MNKLQKIIVKMLDNCDERDKSSIYCKCHCPYMGICTELEKLTNEYNSVNEIIEEIEK